MDNAYDFSLDKKNSEVIISATSNNDDLIISIKDNGIGISENNIEKIFDPLYTTRRDETHHGLGLAIAYNILTNQYNGKLECLSTIGQSTPITLIVPNVVCKKTLCTIS